MEVVAVCDLSEAQIEAARHTVNEALAAGEEASMGRARDAVGYTDYAPMLRNERLDAVYVCLPPFAHGAVEEALIEVELPMLVEKPVALELRVAARVLEGIRRKRLIAASGYQLRYTAWIQRAKELLADRTIGQVLVMRFGRTPRTPWYHLQRKSGGQVVEMATHQVDMLRFLVGEIKTWYGAGATRINHQHQPDYAIFDVNCATLTFENGVVGNFATNFIADHGPPSDARGLHIFCDGMTLSFGSTLRASFANRVEETEVDVDPMVPEDAAFVRAVAEGRPDLIMSDYENGIRTLAVTIAHNRSCHTAAAVDVPQVVASEVPGL